MGQAPQTDLQQYLSLRSKIVEDGNARFELLLILHFGNLLMTAIFEGKIFSLVRQFFH